MTQFTVVDLAQVSSTLLKSISSGCGSLQQPLLFNRRRWGPARASRGGRRGASLNGSRCRLAHNSLKVLFLIESFSGRPVLLHRPTQSFPHGIVGVGSRFVHFAPILIPELRGAWIL